MEIFNRMAGLVVSLILMGHGLANYGLNTCLYLTTWGVVLVSASMFVALVFPGQLKLRSRTLSFTWIGSFMVFLLYWGYLYPNSKDPVDFVNIFRHGGLLIFLTAEFLVLRLPVHEKAISDCFVILMLYSLGILIPRGLAGTPVYDNLTFRNLASWVVYAISISIIFIGNYLLWGVAALGRVVLTKKANKLF